MLYDKSKLNHSLQPMPNNIQTELERVVEWITTQSPVEIAMIWLFGSYARGDFINDVRYHKDGMKSEYHSDVDILVVLPGKTSSRTHKDITKFLNDLKHSPDFNAPFHFIYEGGYRFNDALKKGEYFYQDILKEGVVLFDNDFDIDRPENLSQLQRRTLSIEYFEKFFDKATDFQRGFEFYYQQERLESSIYCLHQTCEHLFAAYLATYTRYRPRTHSLENLRDEVAKLNRHMTTIFPLVDDQDKKDFQFFCAAYVDARYRLNYTVELERLDKLVAWTQDFQHWVYRESMKTLDGFVPEQPYSQDYALKYRLLDLADLKVRPLPETALTIAEQERDAAQKERNSAVEREKQMRAEKEAALKREAELLQKLKDAGLE